MITTLKRAVDHRLRLLNSLYHWKRVPLPDMPSEQLQGLEYLGVARHTMVLRLLSIRNRIEHQDTSPPSQSECRDLVEFVWYFLRSTDVLAGRVNDLILLESQPGFTAPAVEVNTGPKNDWQIEVRGGLPPQYFSDGMHDDWIEVELERFERLGGMIERKRFDLPPEVLERLEEQDPDEIRFNGKVLGPSDRIRELYKTYLTAV